MYFNKTYIDIVKDKNYICRELEQYFKYHYCPIKKGNSIFEIVEL